ncbi:hypothetical protein BT96DRAFT_990986 [Gymnopus androsaceus JB14]|uniref:Uncharacterized protein n=1 Tax=Gymnopus androsaceus JB14 TaxID=1447944 RepID=A0A6A4HXI1_9AGAR|nr:hypothetical protein BT96DRAFT_990986 [Gymnopus androsaceus JB14]
MSDFDPTAPIPNDNIDIAAMEKALATAKEKKEKIRRAREEAARIAREEADRLAREEAERKAEEERLTKEEAERKAEEERLAKEEAERKAREDEAKARSEEEECTRHRESAEKTADKAIAEMHAAEEKIIAEQKKKDKDAAAARVAESSWSGARGGKKKSLKTVDGSDLGVEIIEGPAPKPKSGTTEQRKRKRVLSSEVGVGEAFPTKCGECEKRGRDSCTRWSLKGTTCKCCYKAKVRCSHADRLKGGLRKRMKKDGGEGSVAGLSTEFEDAVLDWLDRIEARFDQLVRLLSKGKGKAKEETKDCETRCMKRISDQRIPNVSHLDVGGDQMRPPGVTVP